MTLFKVLLRTHKELIASTAQNNDMARRPKIEDVVIGCPRTELDKN
jgi:hypothetical protein